MITDTQMGTNIAEIVDGIYRINTPIPLPDGSSFSFNQYLIVDDSPLLFHTGMRRMFPAVRTVVVRVLPVECLCWVSFSHTKTNKPNTLND